MTVIEKKDAKIGAGVIFVGKDQTIRPGQYGLITAVRPGYIGVKFAGDITSRAVLLEELKLGHPPIPERDPT